MNPWFINVRGTNGSGKTTLLRDLAAQLASVEEPIMVQPLPELPHQFTVFAEQGVALLGDYRPQDRPPTTAGCDRIHTQQECKDLLGAIGPYFPEDRIKVVIFEGIMVSTIHKPWMDWAWFEAHKRFTWAFLDTPSTVCLERIYGRNGGRKVNNQLVMNKFDGIHRIQVKVARTEIVKMIRWQTALADLQQEVALRLSEWGT